MYTLGGGGGWSGECKCAGVTFPLLREKCVDRAAKKVFLFATLLTFLYDFFPAQHHTSPCLKHF